MKQRPILFSTLMVQAILEGRKTMTRRVVKPQPDARCLRATNVPFEDWHGKEVKCPYGKPGDVLWVRETVAKKALGFRYKADGDWTDEEREAGEVWPWRPSIHMSRAACRLFLQITDVRVERLQEISEEDAKAEGIDRFRPVPGDGPAQTLYRHYLKNKWGPSPVHSFQTLWEKINGAESWEANPWVWVVEFKRIEKP